MSSACVSVFIALNLLLAETLEQGQIVVCPKSSRNKLMRLHFVKCEDNLHGCE